MRTLAAALAFALLSPLALAAAGPSPAVCSALQAEVETLRAKLRSLEALVVPTAAPAQADPALPGTAAKPSATATLVIEEPFSRTGCRRSLFTGIEAARWQDSELWLDLQKGQSPAEVEKLLGIEHFDERGGDNVIWHYGKCGATSMAQVLFTGGKLADWRAPSN